MLEIKQVSGGVEVTLDIAPRYWYSSQTKREVLYVDAMLQPHDLNRGLGIDPLY